MSRNADSTVKDLIACMVEISTIESEILVKLQQARESGADIKDLDIPDHLHPNSTRLLQPSTWAIMERRQVKGRESMRAQAPNTTAMPTPPHTASTTLPASNEDITGLSSSVILPSISTLNTLPGKYSSLRDSLKSICENITQWQYRLARTTTQSVSLRILLCFVRQGR